MQPTLETPVVTHVVSDAVHVGGVLAAAAAGGGGGDVGHLRKITSDRRGKTPTHRRRVSLSPSLSLPVRCQGKIGDDHKGGESSHKQFALTHFDNPLLIL